MQMEQKTNYEAPLLKIEAASAECGFAQSGSITVNKWVVDSESDSVNF